MASARHGQSQGRHSPESGERTQLQEQVERLLRQDGYPELRRIRCDREEDRLVLQGVVSRYYFKQLALAVARRVSARCPIDNRIEVHAGLHRDAAHT